MSIFRYEFKLNGEQLHNVEMGLKLNRLWEEALDNGNLRIVLSDEDKPLKQYSLLEIKVEELDGGNVIDYIDYEYLIASDVVELKNKYGYYTHNLTLIEYTAKFDAYMMNSFVFSKDVDNLEPAKFTYNDILPPSSGGDEKEQFIFTSNFFIPPLNYLKSRYTDSDEIFFKKSGFGNYFPGALTAEEYDIFDIETFIRINAEIPNNYHILSNESIIWKLPVGKYEIEYGLNIDKTKLRPQDQLKINSQEVLYTFFIEVVSSQNDTMYDVVTKLQQSISKYGGIESKLYQEQTRLFNINIDDEEYLKTIDAPQIFLNTATARQMLVFVLNYVNALPRLKSGEFADELSLEYFNESQGSYELSNISEFMSEQNTNQIGTRSYSTLKNILPNDMNETTTYAPSQSGFQTIRSSGIQLEDGSFELKLPQGKPLYKPTKLELIVPISITNGRPNDNSSYDLNVTLDITDLWIDKSEWNLKEITTNFPDSYWTKAFTKEIGLAKYKTENLSWEQGDTNINLSTINGTVFKEQQIVSVMSYALRRYLTLNQIRPTHIIQGYGVIPSFIIDINLGFNDKYWYKNLKFNVEYITNEDLTVKQDKEDLKQIDFYSEMRHNQDEATIDLTRASRKIYGDLQRTGNVNSSFSKVHYSLSDMYKVGQTDANDYTITSISTTFFNHHIMATYEITKDHNRISQSTFIDQTYRWKDNYAKQLIERNETYNDYLMLVPKDTSYEIKPFNEVTKLSYSDNQKLNLLYEIIFGNLGVRHEVVNTKATVGLVRTDGFITEYPDTTLLNYIMTNISSAGFKQGLVFKLGFKDNQVAGVGIVNKDNNYYNQAVRYTNNKARFNYFDFWILNDYINEDTPEFYDKYPMIEDSQDITMSNYDNKDVISYFGTDKAVINSVSSDSIVALKDPLTNFNLHYALNIMSYFNGLFIIGKKFYSDNHLVRNRNSNDTIRLYIYKDGTTYGLFEDLKVKEGYYKSYDLSIYDYVKIVDGCIEISGLLEQDTSWAIGNDNKDLMFASNENISSIEIIRRHIRPNVDVIGEYTFRIERRIFVDAGYIEGEARIIEGETLTSSGGYSIQGYVSDIIIRYSKNILVNSSFISNASLIEENVINSYTPLTMNAIIGNRIIYSKNILVESNFINSSGVIEENVINGEKVLDMGAYLESIYKLARSINNDTRFASNCNVNEEAVVLGEDNFVLNATLDNVVRKDLKTTLRYEGITSSNVVEEDILLASKGIDFTFQIIEGVV